MNARSVNPFSSDIPNNPNALSTFILDQHHRFVIVIRNTILTYFRMCRSVERHLLVRNRILSVQIAWHNRLHCNLQKQHVIYK